MVGLAVLPHQPGPVHRQHHMELLKRHVVEQHIVAALEEGGVHCKDRAHPLLGHARCHGHRMALGNAHVKKARRKLTGKEVQAGSPLHGGRNGTELAVLLCQGTEGLSKHGGKALP